MKTRNKKWSLLSLETNYEMLDEIENNIFTTYKIFLRLIKHKNNEESINSPLLKSVATTALQF